MSLPTNLPDIKDWDRGISNSFLSYKRKFGIFIGTVWYDKSGKEWISCIEIHSPKMSGTCFLESFSNPVDGAQWVEKRMREIGTDIMKCF